MAEISVIYSRRAIRDLQALDRDVRLRIMDRIEWFAHTGEPLHFSERLSPPHEGLWRFRIGDWRAVFTLESNGIVILHVDHRSRVYR